MAKILLYDYKSDNMTQYVEFKNIRLFKKYGLSPIFNNLRFAEFFMIITTYEEVLKIFNGNKIKSANIFDDKDLVICTVGFDGFVYVEDIYYETNTSEPKILDGEFVFVNHSKVKQSMIKNIDKNSYLLFYEIKKGI